MTPDPTDTAGRRGSILDLPMREPWHRDAVMTAQAANADDVLGWAERIAAAYGKSGTLEVTAVVCSLIDLVHAAACEGHDAT